MISFDLGVNENPSWQPQFGRFFLGRNIVFEFGKDVDVEHDIFKFVIRDGLIECLN